MIIPEVSDVRICILFVGVTLVTMIGAGVQLLRTCIEQAELNSHERMLKTLLRLTPTTDRTGEDG